MATVIKLRWEVPELENMLTLYNTQKVYRSTTGPGGAWTEITTPATRIPLVEGQESYLYDDTAGDLTYWYCVALFNTDTLAEGEKAEPIQGEAVVTPLRLAWEVENLTTIYDAGYTEQRIERSTDNGTSWTEISRSTTRIPLVTEVERYVYADPRGHRSYLYRVQFYDADGNDNGSPQTIAEIDLDGYCSLGEIRAEGLTPDDADSDAVERAITAANAYIDRYTRRYFTPRFARKRFDGVGRGDMLLLGDVPLIALIGVYVDGTEVPRTSLVVYNRHLRAEQIDDRASPKIMISDDILYDDEGERRVTWSYFEKGTQNIEVVGIWGYTELPLGAVAGDTDTDSQTPIEYGETPDLIRWAARKLVVDRAAGMASAEAEEAVASSRLKRLKTRDQEVEYFESGSATAAGGSFAIDPAVHEVLEGFRLTFGVEAI